MKPLESNIRRKWTDREINALKRLYPQFLAGKITNLQMVDLLQRSTDTIRAKACKLNLGNNQGAIIDWEKFEKKCKELGV